ncbi:protein-tyrosine phosphatase-like protein [Pisolithus orientalis]|uniref:protein-tyrosine phosphatase-like protein n=1 Tax=Pisolithus orientalis TaxID=936130 RepID=UPI002224D0A0|nr:protein-tyrosine phosphatase-like protein [Pisolithus orientalis]KAI6007799.1 protein-tyrosine phosphatase-like protein [Pisolithus orientalis]
MHGKHQVSSQVSQRSACLVLPPFLFLGPCFAASSESFLTKNAITHVLSVGARLFTQVDGVAYRSLPINDNGSSSLCNIAGTACNVIDGTVAPNRDNRRILVHCVASISRSPTVVAIYLKKRKGITLKDALGHIIHVRPKIPPSPSLRDN